MPDKKETAVSTFSCVQSATEVQTSGIISRSCFPASLDPSQTWQELMLKAATHENVPTGYRNFLFPNLADELSGSAAVVEK